MKELLSCGERYLESFCDQARNVEGLFAAEGGEDGVEVFEVSVFDDDFAFALLVLDLNLEAQRAAEAILCLANVGIFGLGRFCFFFRFGFRVYEVLDIALGLADGEIECQDLLGCCADGFRGLEGEQGAGVAEGEIA